MKKRFFSFYSMTEKEYKQILSDCLFVLDTSILCNLYRFPQDVQKEFFTVLSSVSERIWIPYQVALEFQKNRLAVIAEQKKKFADTRKLLDETGKSFQDGLSKLQLKKRHSAIDSNIMEKGLNNLFASYKRNLDKLEKKQIDIAGPDRVLKQLDNLLKNNIGDKPSSQDIVNEIYKEGRERFSKRIPPGYKDTNKEKDDEPFHEYEGIIYERQYGDLVIWKQIIEECKTRSQKSLVFLVDDTKEDWWWIVNGKRIGPRPELREEIGRLAGVNNFHIYNSEQFLTFATKHLNAKVSQNSISAAKDVLEFQEGKSWAENIISDKMSDIATDLINSDELIVGMLAETNASGFGLDTYEILFAEHNKNKKEIFFQARIWISGESDLDKPFNGDEIVFDLYGTLKHYKNDWILESYDIEDNEIVE
ncbi:MAG: DUF4935 domain-containing protein [Chloroflexi bacterium]|nr:DUF4935 domain-containing protein [Chloroflexota bacterium]